MNIMIKNTYRYSDQTLLSYKYNKDVQMVMRLYGLVDYHENL